MSTNMWFDLNGDQRLGRCSTDGCGGQPTFRLEAEGVGSNYCSGCRDKIENPRSEIEAARAETERLLGILMRYRYAVRWFADDDWQPSEEIITMFGWARAHDLNYHLSQDEFREAARQFHTRPKTRPRFEWRVNDFDPDEEICIDRLTGKIIIRYDLGDPANYAPSHGGWSHSEYLERKGFDPRQRIPIHSSTDA